MVSCFQTTLSQRDFQIIHFHYFYNKKIKKEKKKKKKRVKF